MQRSKIIAGMAILLLSGIGVYASNSKPKFVTYFYIPSGGGCATSPNVTFTCSSGTPTNCTTTVNGTAGVQLYGVNPGGGADCTTPLKKD